MPLDGLLYAETLVQHLDEDGNRHDKITRSIAL
jgi:hypothetical protein